jgi:hypothetical protein
LIAEAEGSASAPMKSALRRAAAGVMRIFADGESCRRPLRH